MSPDAVWKTQDGRRIPVKEMADRHLVNTIRMLRRKGFVTPDEFDSMFVAAASLNGEMAQMAAEQDLAAANPLPALADLLEEAGRRGLTDGVAR